MCSKSKSITMSKSPPRYIALYTPTPEHRWTTGIPARNLSAAEVEQYGIDALKRAQCYRLVPVEAPEE